MCCTGNIYQCRFAFPVQPLPQIIILEPPDVNSDENKVYKEKCNKILKHLQVSGKGQNIQPTFNVMLNVLDMTYKDYKQAVRTAIVRPNVIPAV